MNRCKACIIPDTRPDTEFIDGECTACIAYRNRQEINWEERKQALLELLARHKHRCIVPSSGGKDSHYQVLKLLELGADVTVITATTCHLTEIGRRNIDNLARYARTIEVTPNRQTRAKLNRMGLEMVGDISWPEHVSIFTTPFRMAAHLGIPLLFYGENPQNQYGGPTDSIEALTMTRRWVSEYGGFLGLRPTDIEAMGYNMADYKMPTDFQVLSCGVDGPLGTMTRGMEAHFLGQYLPWDSHENARLALSYGMEFNLPSPANWWGHENLDNAQTGLHDHMMYRKYGYGRGCSQLAVDVRTGEVNREAALKWVSQNDGLFPFMYAGVSINDMLARLGMTQMHLVEILARFTNKELFVNPETNWRPLLKEFA